MLYDFLVKAKVTSFQASPSLVYTSLTKNGNETSRPPTSLVNCMSLYTVFASLLLVSSSLWGRHPDI